MTHAPTPIDEVLEDYRQALLDAALWKSRAEAAEDVRKSAYASAVSGAPEGISVAKAEYAAFLSERYTEAVANLNEAREKAEEAKAHVAYLSTRIEVWRSRESTRRAEFQKQGGYRHADS